MKKSFWLTALLACLTIGVAQADNALIDFQGYSWETGGLLPSNSGDLLSIVGVVDNIDARFGINLLVDEVTLFASNLVSTGQVLNSGVYTIAYTGGTLELYQDPSRNHDYGVNPPNATAPPTFVDGTLFLGGTLSNFFLYYDTATNTGGYQATCLFTAGSGLATLNQIDANGYTFGGVLSPAAVGSNVPQGYDLQVDGVIEVEVRTAVEQQSWGAVKSLYNAH